MNKIITKILDKYYSKKLIDEILQSLRFTFDLDFRTEYNKDKVRLYIKKRKYKDEEYYQLYYFRYEEAFNNLLRIDKVKSAMRECVEMYLKEEY